MNKIHIVGQAITSTNYATSRLFNFNPEPVRQAAENFLASGVAEIEIPQGVLDPNKASPETGIDEPTLKQTIAGLPDETRVVATYLGSGKLGEDNAAYLETQKRDLDLLFEHFPEMRFAVLHPASAKHADKIPSIVEAFAKLAEYAASLRPDAQLVFHNHFDTSGETEEQARAYLAAVAEADLPALRWGPDTGHCHGMGDAYLDVFEEHAHLIGDYFHIKARVPAFDKRHGGDQYAPDRDIWGNKAEVGSGLYGGFVNVADPEIETPFAEIFRLVREKARPRSGVVRGAVEIDNPRQHPRLEALCATLYLTRVHGLETDLNLSADEIVARVFAGR